jgi:TRIAD3 protein (E3 ubiquitin-protein ligase RNF216)
MDTSSCLALFPDSELTRLLSVKSLHLYHRLKQASELESAGIEGLESCPNCPFSAIIENPDEKLFRCMAPDCGTVTCRKCRRVEHLPKSCEGEFNACSCRKSHELSLAENEAERRLDKRHAVEDAMSAALIRQCPKCEKPYVKEWGCNKITVSRCFAIHPRRSLMVSIS